MSVGGASTATRRMLPAPASGLPLGFTRRWLPGGRGEPPHRHPVLEVCHIEAGRGRLTANGQTTIVPAQSLTLLPPGTVHALTADGGWSCTANLLHFDPDAVVDEEAAAAVGALLRLAAGGRASVVLRGAAAHATTATIARLASLCRDGDGQAEPCRTLLAAFCTALCRQFRELPSGGGRRSPSGGTATADHPASPAARPEIDVVLAYIEGNLTRPISRQELAQQASFAPSYFSALFRETTGTTIPEYINLRRIRRAQELLRAPETRVSAVCYAVGFRDLSNFNRVFKRIVGQTPREYRQEALGVDEEEEAGR